MTGKVSRVYKKIPLSSLGIFKVTEYPFEHRDFKPFALARLCVLDDEFLVARLWSFEVSPKAEVTQKSEDILKDSVLNFAVGSKEKFLVFTFNNKGVVMVQNEQKEMLDGEVIHNHFFTGEDLQGIYWGAELKIPLEFIKTHTDVDLNDGVFEGNIFKTSFGNAPHFGGFFPVKAKDLFSPANFGTFEITEY